MGEYAMAINEQDQEKLKDVLRKLLPEILQEQEVKQFEKESSPAPRPDINLVERIVRVEEAMVHMQELIKEQMRLIDKRFEQVDKRFEQVDKRFEQVDKRFDAMQHQMDKRFNMLQWFIGLGFAGISVLMGLLNYF